MRVAEEEIKEILKEREEQKKENELIVSVYDTERNEKAKAHREELVIPFTCVLIKLFEKMYFVHTFNFTTDIFEVLNYFHSNILDPFCFLKLFYNSCF